MKNRAISQVVIIEEKGYKAFLDGKPKRPTPYEGGYNGGGSVQKWRRAAWIRGWELAERHKNKKSP